MEGNFFFVSFLFPLCLFTFFLSFFWKLPFALFRFRVTVNACSYVMISFDIAVREEENAYAIIYQRLFTYQTKKKRKKMMIKMKRLIGPLKK